MKKTFLKITLTSIILLLGITLKAQQTWTTTAGNTLTAGPSLPSSPNEWLGTSNAADLIIRTNSIERFRVTSTGSIGVNQSSPAHFFDVKVPNITGGENMLNIGVSDASSDFFRISNGTSSNYQFMPLVVGHKGSGSSTAAGLYMVGSIASNADVSSVEPVFHFNARRDFPTSGGSAITTRPLFVWSNYSTKYMTMMPNGFLGINTTAPIKKLHVNGDVYITGQGADGLPTSASLFLGDDQTTPQFGVEYDGAGLNFWKPWGSNNFANYLLYVKDNGNVGIGTNNPGSYKLAVEGKIGAREIVVTLDSPWPDYVFGKDYKKMNLAEIEKYVKQNSHLPGIPSAEDLYKEKGLAIGNMQVLQMQKTEEIFLYLIELNKKVEVLNIENAELRKKIEELKK